MTSLASAWLGCRPFPPEEIPIDAHAKGSQHPSRSFIELIWTLKEPSQTAYNPVVIKLSEGSGVVFCRPMILRHLTRQPVSRLRLTASFGAE